MKLLITMLVLSFSISKSFAENFQVSELKCAKAPVLSFSTFPQIDLKDCRAKGILEDDEIRQFVINHVDEQGNRLDSINLVTNLDEKAINQALSSSYLSDVKRAEVKILLSSPNLQSVDAFYVVDNYYGGTGMVTYLVIRDLDHYTVTIVPVLTYSE